MRTKIFLILIIALNGFAQEQTKFPFIAYELNQIHYPKDSSSFIKLFEKMQAFSQNKSLISVTHIGGSHVQGGTWSNSFAAYLQNELKAGGGGYFMFPYRMAKTNAPPFSTSFTNGHWKKCRCIGKEFCLPLGMSGMSISTNDSSNYFGVALTKKAIIREFDLVKVYHNFNPGFEFKISDKHNIPAVRTDRKDLGYTEFKLEAPVDSLLFDLTRKDSILRDFTLYGFAIESTRSGGVFLAALGANGATSNSFLKCNYFVEQLRTLSPDLVILSLGVNDTQSKSFGKEEYIEHYDSLISKVKEANPDAAILLTTTTDNYVRRRTSNKRPILAKEAMFELMKKHNVAVWDLYSIMGGYKSIVKWGKAGLAAKDRVHFSPKGYTIIGDLMGEALFKSYHNYIKK